VQGYLPTLRVEYRLRVLENRVLKRTFGNKWEQVTGECRQLHTEELHNVFSPPHVTKQGIYHVQDM
jgi:hypothetical protein